MVDPMGWLAVREPAPPKELGAWLRIDPVEGETMAGVLSAAAAEELGEALARPGRSREGAYHLLAADALMTYACEAAAARVSISHPGPCESGACCVATATGERTCVIAT